MKTKSYAMTKLVWLMCLYTITGCTQDTIQTPTPYDGCCGTAPKVYEVEDYKVYIPNVITPNGDGINDAFYPICNKMEVGKFAVANYQILNDTGQVIYALNGLDISDPENWAFSGIGLKNPYKPREHEQFLYTGKFQYTFLLAFRTSETTEELIEVKGEGCVVRCDKDAHVLKNKEGCYFPVQGKGGVYDSSISPNEENCIK